MIFFRQIFSVLALCAVAVTGGTIRGGHPSTEAAPLRLGNGIPSGLPVASGGEGSSKGT